MKKYYISIVILMLSLISSAKECDNLIRTTGIYWETDNLIEVIQMEYGTDYTIGDWLDLKALPDIDEWITCMELVDDDQFILTRDGEYIYSGNRQYFVQYFADGDVPGTWLVHDHIGNKLFLGSWYGIEMSLLAFHTETSFMLSSPNGGEYWKWDTQHLINWTANDSIIENVNIRLSYDSGVSYDDLLFENTANDGEELWTIPEAQCNTARIKIEGYDAEGALVAEDESDSDFDIYITPPINLDSGLVAFYPFNGNADDESGNNNHGTVYGAILSTDRFGDADKAYGFDGVDNHIEKIDPSNLPIGGNARTIEAWINPINTNPGGAIVSYGDAFVGSGQEFIVAVVTSNGGNTYLFTDGLNGPNNIVIYGSEILPNNLWTHIAFIFEANNWKYYLNGELKKSGTFSISINTATPTNLQIGQRSDLDGPSPDYYIPFPGIIDDIRIYNRALNELEIQALYHEGDWKIKPTFIYELDDRVACKNDSIAFEAIAEGITPINYQWQKDGVNISGATDSIFIIPNVQSEDDGEYRCIATNDYGTGSSNTATLSVEFALPTIISGFTSVHEYQVATYSADMQEGHTYEFIVEGGNVIDGTENSVTVHWGEPGQGFISLIESSDLGCFADTNVLNVTVGYLGIEDHETNKLSVYPNPFSTTTTLEFESTHAGKVKIEVFNHLGELIDIVQMNCRQGKNEFIWKAENHPSGIYFIRLLMNENVQIIKALKY